MGVVKIKKGRALRVAAFAGITLLVLYVIFSSSKDSIRPVKAVKKVKYLIKFLASYYTVYKHTHINLIRSKTCNVDLIICM